MPSALVSFLVYLLLLVTTTKQQACDRNHLRLILEQDVVQYIYPAFQASPCSIYDLLSTRSCTFWCAPASLALPRGIDITFAQPFVLEGISTQGKDNGFVSKFTVLYSESSDGPLQPFVDVTLPSDNGHSFILPVSIVMQRLRLLMTDTSASPASGYFYWHLDFLGCTLASTNKTAGGPSDTDTGITLVSSPVMAIPSADDGPSEPATLATPSLTDTCSDTTLSVTFKQTVISTHTLTVTDTILVSPPSPSPSLVGSALIIEGVQDYFFPALSGVLMLILLSFIVILLAVCVSKRRRSKSKQRSSTLMEVTNNNLYEMDDDTLAVINNINSSHGLPPAPPAPRSQSMATTTTQRYIVNRDEMKTPLIDNADFNDEMYASLTVYQGTRHHGNSSTKEYESICSRDV